MRPTGAGRQPAPAALVADREGLDLAVRFVDRVARPEDPEVAARALARLPTGAARFLGLGDRLLLRAGSRLAPLAPRVVVPLARRRRPQLVGHLVVDARDPALARHLARARAVGVRLNLNLLGEAVLGEREAARRAERTLDLLRREDVDHVSIKVSSLVSQISPWDTPGTVARVVERLRPLYEAARERSPRAFVNLDMEEYRDLHLTLEVFTALLDEPDLRDLEAGIALQAYLPDSVDAFERLAAFATDRVARGGAGIKVRLVKGEPVDGAGRGRAAGLGAGPHGSKRGRRQLPTVVERALRPRAGRPGGSASPPTTSTTWPSPTCWRRPGRHRRWTSRCSRAWHRPRPGPSARRRRRAAAHAGRGARGLRRRHLLPVRRLEENAQPHNFLHAPFAEGPSAVGDQEARPGVGGRHGDRPDRPPPPERPPTGPARFANTPTPTRHCLRSGLAPSG